jgi:hypothetical protein
MPRPVNSGVKTSIIPSLKNAPFETVKKWFKTVSKVNVFDTRKLLTSLRFNPQLTITPFNQACHKPSHNQNPKNVPCFDF